MFEEHSVIDNISMQIVQATESDISGIVELLKLSLGETLMPKSEAYWRWKHIDNPFGESEVWLAKKGDKIIGVRAFLNWEWQNNEGQIAAIRAVDTATHPEYQGQGIFKTLTKKVLERCELSGVDLVYNTPNESSKPGYLKMGWQEAGKLPVKIRVKRPFNMLVSKLIGNNNAILELDDNQYNLESIVSNYKGDFKKSSFWATSYSITYLLWRYIEIPIIKYYGHAYNDGIIIFRLKNTTLGWELRICDFFGDVNHLSKAIDQLYRQCTFDYLSICGFSQVKLGGVLTCRMSMGPHVTVRSLNKFKLDSFLAFSNWKPSLGDIEVF